MTNQNTLPRLSDAERITRISTAVEAASGMIKRVLDPADNPDWQQDAVDVIVSLTAAALVSTNSPDSGKTTEQNTAAFWHAVADRIRLAAQLKSQAAQAKH